MSGHQIIKNSANSKGFSLIEVMVAISIFAIGYMAMSSLQFGSTGQNATASRLTVATSWTADQVEKLIGQDYDNIGAGNGSINSPDGLYTVAWTIAPNIPLTNTKTITISTTRNGARLSKNTTSITFTYIKGKTI